MAPYHGTFYIRFASISGSESRARGSIPGDTISGESFFDDIDGTSVSTGRRGLQSRLCQIEWMPWRMSIVSQPSQQVCMLSGYWKGQEVDEKMPIWEKEMNEEDRACDTGEPKWYSG